LVVSDVFINSQSVLIEWQDPFESDGDLYFTAVLHKELSSYIASNLLVPLSKIKIYHHKVVDDFTVFRFPGDKKLSVGAEINIYSKTLRDDV